ncbi:MAG: ThiF family adenylyltransferase [Clostridia bacterium]|nr:ThiF family adenylyltransferase [Clostridia bacterium]
MEHRHDRLKSLIGEEKLNTLKNSKVIVFGVGGVGGAVIEALARSGVGEIAVVDNDKFEPTNLNRQILATEKTLGKSKVEVAIARIAEIDSKIKTTGYDTFYLPETADKIDLEKYDLIVDAIDTVTAKIYLAEQAQKLGKKIISAMGTGNKIDPTAFKVADIYQTDICPLCRVMRSRLKKRGIDKLKVVYSTEPPVIKSQIPASNASCPLVAGLIIANEAIKMLYE